MKLKLVSTLAQLLLLHPPAARAGRVLQGDELEDETASRSSSLSNDSPSDLINDINSYLTFNELLVREGDCDGVYAEWAGNRAADDENVTSTVVRYDYDLFVDDDLNMAIADIQRRVLTDVGRDVFPGCFERRYLAEFAHRVLFDVAIEEISTAPADSVLTSSTCEFRDESGQSTCYPITGSITAYYFGPSGRRLDTESSIQDTILSSVERSMESIDTVMYLGDRESYTLDENHLSVDQAQSQEGSKNDPSGETGTPRWVILTGAGAGLAVLVAAVLLLLVKKRKSSMGDATTLSEEEREVVREVEEELEYQEKEVEVVPQEVEEEKGGRHESCNFLDVLKCDECI